MRPTWDWKSPRPAELDHFTIAYATREYVQNQVGQILKGIKSREWADWTREDLRESTDKERLSCKDALVKGYPGLLTGPHGRLVRNSKDWLPTYVLKARVKAGDLKVNEYPGTDLLVCTVVWTWKNSFTGLSFYNNHLDSKAQFKTFVVDGASTSGKSEFAVGEKGKGFIMATQWFYEEVEDTAENHVPLAIIDGTNTTTKPPKLGVSFRVGHQLGELKWKQRNGYIEQLKVTMDDLTPVTVEALVNRAAIEQERDEDDDDEDGSEYSDEDDRPKSKKVGRGNSTPITGKKVQAITNACRRLYERRHKNKLSAKLKPVANAMNPSHEVTFSQPDEVVITILGLPKAFAEKVEDIFLGIYGIIPPPRSWRIPNTLVMFFPASGGIPPFYNRDQLVPDGPRLLTMGINYFGVMTLTADRQSIIRNGRYFELYQDEVSKAADLAFQTDEELAVELACEILAPKSRGSALPLRNILEPGSKNHGEKYKAAFYAAWRRADPKIPTGKDIFPFTPGSSGDRETIEEYGMIAQEVNGQVMEILRKSGAFGSLEDYANALLNDAPHLTKPRAGIERFRRAMTRLVPAISKESILMKQFPYKTPSAAWDKSWRTLSLAEPGVCDQPEHEDEECLCWVGPYLWKATRKGQEAGLVEVIESEIWRAYIDCMEGVVDMQEPPTPSFSISRPTSPAMSCSSDNSFTQQELGYPTQTPQNEEMPMTSFLTKSNVSNKVTQKLDAVRPTSRPTSSISLNSGPLAREREQISRQMPPTARDSEDHVIPPSSSVLSSPPPITPPRGTASATGTIQTTPTLHSSSARPSLHDFDGWINKITDSFRREYQQNAESASRFEKLQEEQAKIWQLRVSELEKAAAAKDQAISEWKTISERNAKRIEELEAAELAFGSKLQDVIAQHCSQIQTQTSVAGSKRRRVEMPVVDSEVD
ncbi:hypothetical protein BD410DRAFT_567872 [Rickenella mellea]|uniref:Uncharacterized protein n=1 Tax=Rickenella mellea TaxID=50990 RepID=A0A4Y7QFV9_9AGAM|nr:hypothetical protein BD410DRAFT_567872 [Rickenella mellea]